MAADLQKKDLKTFLREAEGLAMGEYSTALSKGDELPAAERKAVDKKAVAAREAKKGKDKNR